MKYYLKNKEKEILLTAKDHPENLKYSSEYNDFSLTVVDGKKRVEFGKVRYVNKNYERVIIKYIESFPNTFERCQFGEWLVKNFSELKVRFEYDTPEYDYYSLEKKYKLNNEDFDITIGVSGEKNNYLVTLYCTSNNVKIKKEYSVIDFMKEFKVTKREQDLKIVALLESGMVLSNIFTANE